MIKLTGNNEYINTTDYTKLETKLTQLKSILDELIEQSTASRKLRYSEIDIEVEREAGRIQPDEIYVPCHIIDTNIRREQSSYVQYITQSPRAVILRDKIDPSIDLSILERDLTDKLRYEGWQLPQFANIDAFQANGYSIMELVYDESQPGHVAHEQVQFGDFAFVSDTRNIQDCEIVCRNYHYTKSKLLKLCGDPLNPQPEDWVKDQVDKVVNTESLASQADPGESTDSKDKSLFKIQKLMFRVNGIVQVGWAAIGVGDDWLRPPRPLYIGRRQLVPENPLVAGIKKMAGALPKSTEQYETNYPYFTFNYLISENDTITHSKGRVFLDQDVQEAVSSLLSSTCTQARRASGMYFSKDTSDPNDDLMLQKNIFFKSGCIVNSKISAFKLDAPDPAIFSAIQLLVTGNQQETSQINFAANNRKDSRKTAAEIKESASQQQILSTVQVVLFSLGQRKLSSEMCSIIKSRVLAGLIQVNQQVAPLYQRDFFVKPSGDTDVIEKQQLIQTMTGAWQVMQNTAAATQFMCDLLEKMFPDNAAKYVQIIQQAQQQQQSAQAQQQQQLVEFSKMMAQEITELAKHPDMFSDLGKLHALPQIEAGARQIEQVRQKMLAQQQPQQKQ